MRMSITALTTKSTTCSFLLFFSLSIVTKYFSIKMWNYCNCVICANRSRYRQSSLPRSSANSRYKWTNFLIGRAVPSFCFVWNSFVWDAHLIRTRWFCLVPIYCYSHLYSRVTDPPLPLLDTLYLWLHGLCGTGALFFFQMYDTWHLFIASLQKAICILSQYIRFSNYI